MKKYERQLEQSWKENAAAWTNSIREQQIESRKLVTDRAILDEITSYQPQKVLDVGCGEGWLARTLSERGIEVIGFDGSEELIKQAEQKGGGTFYCLSYEEYCQNPAQLGRFDVIICNFSLLSQEIHTLLRALSNQLTSDGVLLIQTLHPFAVIQQERYEDGWKEETFTSMGEGYKAAMPWYFRTVGSWLHELHAADLRLQKCQEPIHPHTGKPLSLLLTAVRDERKELRL